MAKARLWAAKNAEEAKPAPVVEDVHWADQSTYDLLSFLFARGFAEPVSIVVSYRSDELHRRHPLRAVAAGWHRLPRMGRLVLDPLSDEQVRQLVHALDPGPLPPGALQAVVERAAGNAFFAEELVAAIGSTSLPKDLAELLLLRLDQLPPDGRLVVQAAAAGGRLVGDAVLARVSGLDPDRYAAAVRSAVERHVLVPEEDGYRFRHSMLAESVYDDLLPGERRRVHAAYVAALTGEPGRSAPAELARHALAAGDPATAYAASVRAGRDAEAVGGPDEALRHYTVALDLLTAGDAGVPAVGEDTVTLTERAAASAGAAGLVRRAEALVAEQLRRLPATASPRHRARLLVAMAEAASLSDSLTDLLPVTEEAIGLVDAEPPTPLRARAVAAYAAELAGLRRDSDAVRWAEEGLAMPPEVRPGEVTVQLQTVLAKALERSGDSGASQRVLRELAAVMQAAGDPAEVRVLHQLGLVHLEQGELGQALEVLRRGAQRSVALGRTFAPYGVDCRVLAGVAAYQLGDWDLALDLVDVDLDRAPGLAAAGLLAIELTVRAGRGNGRGWRDVLARIRPEWTTEGMVAVNSGAAAIELAGDAGDLAEALAVHDEVVACLRRLWGVDDSQARIRLAALVVGQVATHLSELEPERRPGLLAAVADLAEHGQRAHAGGRRSEPGAESRAWLARLAAERLRLRRAAGLEVHLDHLVAAWQEAVDRFADYGHAYEQARSAARLAVALRDVGDRDRAGRTAAAAVDTARALGAAPLLAELRPLVGGRVLGGGAAVEVLTPREREVLTLVAAGRTNREVGEALFVSTKTASVHVSNILAKLGARTRTEAVSVARRRGLLP